MIEDRPGLGDIDTEILDQRPGVWRILERIFDVCRAAQFDEHAALVMKFVALGVAAEVVVIIEHEDSSVRTAFFLEIVSGRQAADSAAHDNEIVFLVRIDGVGRIIPLLAIANQVRQFKGAGMTAAHAFAGWRIVAGHILGRSRMISGRNDPRR